MDHLRLETPYMHKEYWSEKSRFVISIKRKTDIQISCPLWQATLVLLPRKSHGWRSLVGCSPWGRYKSDATERLHFHFSLSCNGEGNGNPLQCSCLENPRDGGAWWAAVYGVAQSRTRLKRLSSSSSKLLNPFPFMVQNSVWILYNYYQNSPAARAWNL